MDTDNILIPRLCHDLITPFNAISLGIDALDISGERTIVDSIKESADKANSILKYVRELFSDNDSIQMHPRALQEVIADFLNKYKITLTIETQLMTFSGELNKILLFNGMLAKELLPLGGQMKFSIDEPETIVSKYRGVHLLKPTFDFDASNINYKSIMRYKLKKYLEQHDYIVKVDQIDDEVILLEKKI